jgi:hypothetical protein
MILSMTLISQPLRVSLRFYWWFLLSKFITNRKINRTIFINKIWFFQVFSHDEFLDWLIGVDLIG